MYSVFKYPFCYSRDGIVTLLLLHVAQQYIDSNGSII